MVQWRRCGGGTGADDGRSPSRLATLRCESHQARTPAGHPGRGIGAAVHAPPLSSNGGGFAVGRSELRLCSARRRPPAAATGVGNCPEVGPGCLAEDTPATTLRLLSLVEAVFCFGSRSSKATMLQYQKTALERPGRASVDGVPHANVPSCRQHAQVMEDLVWHRDECVISSNAVCVSTWDHVGVGAGSSLLARLPLCVLRKTA